MRLRSLVGRPPPSSATFTTQTGTPLPHGVSTAASGAMPCFGVILATQAVTAFRPGDQGWRERLGLTLLAFPVCGRPTRASLRLEYSILGLGLREAFLLDPKMSVDGQTKIDRVAHCRTRSDSP